MCNIISFINSLKRANTRTHTEGKTVINAGGDVTLAGSQVKGKRVDWMRKPQYRELAR